MEIPPLRPVIKTKGKPSGSNGVGVYKTRGRLVGSTEANGFSIGKSGGRPTGSTEANGFDSSKVGGRPIGTTKLGVWDWAEWGRIWCSVKFALFKDDMELPDEWDTSTEAVNIDCCVNVHLELHSEEHLIVHHLLLGFVIPVVGFYGIPVTPTILALLGLLVE